MGPEWTPENPADLLLTERPPADRHPVEIYLADRTLRSRDVTREALDDIAALLTVGQGTADTLAWHLLRADHVTNIRTALTERYTAAEAGRRLAALRGVLRECWRRGLMEDADYRRLREIAAVRAGDGAAGRRPPRGELRSVFESCGEDGPPASERGSAVRTLLYGNGNALTPEHVPVPAARAAMTPLPRRRVTPREAIAHALWEADVCLRQWAFCGCLAMLRKALDLWSAGYRDKHGLAFNQGVGERDDLYGRLRKIAEENKLYEETIHTIIDGVHEDAPDGAVVCRGGYVSSYDGLAAMRTKECYRRLHELVVTLIAATTPDLPI